MLFWIFLAVIVAIIVFTFYRTEDGLDTFMAGFVSTIILGLTLLALTALNYQHGTVDTTSQETLKLKALGNNTATTANRGYYLGGSYLGTKRVLNYMTTEANAIRVEAADAATSTVYEDTEASNANVIVYHQIIRNEFFVPWNIGTMTSYDFHIPAGSVVESYTLDNK